MNSIIPRSRDGMSTSCKEAALEPLLSFRQAAAAAGLKYWLLLRAANSGEVPTYQFGNTRRRVRLSDIEAVIAGSKAGLSI